MNLKKLLKAIKLNESTISMLLGAVVIIVVGVLVVNFFADRETGETIPTLETEETSLPTTHTVSEGEDLWSISEEYYDTGYNWVDIAEENNITNPNQIEEGQSLTIPDVEPRELETELEEEDSESTPEPTATNTPTPEPTDAPEQVQEDTIEVDEPIRGASYTVVKGDTLWDIAVRAYGDGYRWVEIARENQLANPNIIHPGNVFTIPR